MDHDRPHFRYPSTRYAGSKLRLLDWIWEHLKDLPFESALDVFGGTGSVSLLFKYHGKQVLYNDLLGFNQIIGRAIIENDSIVVSDDELASLFDTYSDSGLGFIQERFAGIFYTDEENAWLDGINRGIWTVSNPYKRCILMSALFQACLAKRPFNLFHRANLYLRTADVRRTFGNKTTWNRSFPELVRRFVHEYNQAVFSNGKQNRVIGGYDALSSPNGVDLVYLDPPFFGADIDRGTNYLLLYHFLEGLADPHVWASKASEFRGRVNRVSDTPGIQSFTRKSGITNTFARLIDQFKHSKIVLSYQDDGIPSKTTIVDLLTSVGKRVDTYERPYQYALSRRQKKALLFVAW